MAEPTDGVPAYYADGVPGEVPPLTGIGAPVNQPYATPPTSLQGDKLRQETSVSVGREGKPISPSTGG